MSSLIIFVLGAFAGSLIACIVLSACVISGMAGKREYRKPKEKAGGDDR